ncbi:type II secretion system F family protein, partial [Paraburkholderia sp. Se-20369]|nr:type II secretion system F family protein [Paraburkholderia sp. Se-20369]
MIAHTPPRETRFAWRGRRHDGAPCRGTVIAFDAAGAPALLARTGIPLLSLAARGAARPPIAPARELPRLQRHTPSLAQARL